MNFTKVFSLFALLSLVILSLGAVSAQTNPTCLTNQSSGFPASIVNNQISLSGSLILALNTGSCNPRYISSITAISTLNGNNLGTWSFTGLPNPPIIATIANTSVIGTFTFSTANTGQLSTIVTVNAVSLGATTNSTETYTYTLPSVAITAPSSLSITAQTTQQPILVGQNVSLSISNPNGLSNIVLSETGVTLFGVTFSPLSTLASGVQTAQAMLTNLQNLKFGANTVNVQASAGTQTASTSFEVRKTFCSVVPLVSNLTIKNIDISNDGEGDEDKWELLDEIDVEVELENINQDDDIDAVLEIGLYDETGRNLGNDLVFLSDSDGDDEKIEININEDDSETVNFKFQVPSDFDSGNYKLVFKVYDDDLGESKSCRDSSSDLDNGYFQAIEVIEASDEGRYVVVQDYNIDSQVVCGTTLSGQFTIFNIGEDDQDRVKVLIRNTELNINEYVELTSDLDKGEDETLSFSVKIPSTVSNGVKHLEFFAEYDYKNGVYREEADESSSFPIEVIGCSQNIGNSGSGSALTNAKIEAELSSDAMAGQELIVTSTITNTGTTSKSFTIDARGYSNWAELTDISDESFTLEAGESKEIVFKFMINEDSTGSQAFDVQLSSDGKVQVQEVEVELTESAKGFSFDLKGNSTLWIIGLVNAVLIILIIVVAVRLSRK